MPVLIAAEPRIVAEHRQLGDIPWPPGHRFECPMANDIVARGHGLG